MIGSLLIAHCSGLEPRASSTKKLPAFAAESFAKQLLRYYVLPPLIKSPYKTKNAEALLQHVEPGKEYYFTSGHHVAIIRKNGDVFEFLELQDKPQKNGFRPLTSLDLEERFGTRSKFKWHDYLIDIEKLKDSPNFRELLGYFNTVKEKK